MVSCIRKILETPCSLNPKPDQDNKNILHHASTTHSCSTGARSYTVGFPFTGACARTIFFGGRVLDEGLLYIRAPIQKLLSPYSYWILRPEYKVVWSRHLYIYIYIHIYIHTYVHLQKNGLKDLCLQTPGQISPNIISSMKYCCLRVTLLQGSGRGNASNSLRLHIP